jgi:hypothetical protein
MSRQKRSSLLLAHHCSGPPLFFPPSFHSSPSPVRLATGGATRTTRRGSQNIAGADPNPARPVPNQHEQPPSSSRCNRAARGNECLLLHPSPSLPFPPLCCVGASRFLCLILFAPQRSWSGAAASRCFVGLGWVLISGSRPAPWCHAMSRSAGWGRSYDRHVGMRVSRVPGGWFWGIFPGVDRVGPCTECSEEVITLFSFSSHAWGRWLMRSVIRWVHGTGRLPPLFPFDLRDQCGNRFHSAVKSRLLLCTFFVLLLGLLYSSCSWFHLRVSVAWCG